MIESDDHTFYCIIVVVTVDLETKSHKKDMMKAKYFCKSKFASGVTQGDAFSKKKVHIYIQNLFIIDVHLGKENSLRMGMLLIFIFYFFPFDFGFFFFYLFFLSFLKPRVRIVSFFVALLRPDPLSVDVSGQ